LGADVLGAVVPFASGGGMAVRAAAHADDIVDVARGVDDSDVIMRVVEEGKPGFQLRSGEEGLSVFDKNMISPEETLQEFRPNSSITERTVAQIRDKGMDVVRTPGNPAHLSPKACRAHCEIVPGPEMTRNQ
jgi:hypothetical protein